MTITRFFVAALAAIGAAPLCYAQPVTVTASSPTITNLYAQQQIDLLPGFETSTSGFEANIKFPENTHGRWSKSLLWTSYQRYQDPHTPPPSGVPSTTVTGMIGVHTHVLPNGKVLSWEGHIDDEHRGPTMMGDALAHAYQWNPNPAGRANLQVYPNVYDEFENAYTNLFCSGHSFLPDGRLLVAGGHYSGGLVDRRAVPSDPDPNNAPVNSRVAGNLDYIPPGYAGNDVGYVNGPIGLRDANIFHFSGNAPGSTTPWQANMPYMEFRRWYPTSTTLANGDVLVTAGQRYGDVGAAPTIQALVPEVYNPGTGWRTLSSATASRRLTTYPWMFQAPDGRVFNAGPNVRTGFLNPFATPVAGLNPSSWVDGPLHVLGGARAPAGAYDYQERQWGTAVMYLPGKILIAGGQAEGSATTPWTVTNTTELLDLSAAQPAWRTAAPMAYPRAHANATLLADGTVLVTGGIQQFSLNDADAALPAELWTPPNSKYAAGRWTPLNALSVPRLYHSMAVLLPDATVLTAGGGGAGFRDHPDYEIFTPPYLCQGRVRPEISSAPQAVAYGLPFVVSTPNATDILQPGGRATLVRLSSVTHSFNMNQRLLELTPTSNGAANQVQQTALGNPNECPPGHYMLFLLDRYGTPSHASIIAVNTSVCSTALSIAQSSPNPPQNAAGCSRTTIFTATGGPVGSTYNWTVNGTSYGTTGPSDTISLITSTASPTVQVTVALAGNADCGASSTLTSYFPGCQP